MRGIDKSKVTRIRINRVPESTGTEDFRKIEGTPASKPRSSLNFKVTRLNSALSSQLPSRVSRVRDPSSEDGEIRGVGFPESSEAGTFRGVEGGSNSSGGGGRGVRVCSSMMRVDQVRGVGRSAGPRRIETR